MALTRPKIWDIDTNVEWFVDPITVLHQASIQANVDVGFLFNRANGLVSNVALYWNESSQSFVTAFTSSDGTTNTNIAVTSYANITTGNIVASTLISTGNVVAANVVASSVYASSIYSASIISAATIGNVGANIVGTGTYLTSLSGSNVTGTVASATTSQYVTGLTASNVQAVIGSVSAGSFPTLNQNTTGTAATVTTASQPTITTLAGLTSFGTAGVNTSAQGNLVVGMYLTVPSGSGQFNGPYNESTASSGVFVGNTGSGTPSPRIGFFNGTTAQNWQIDNYGGTFRWFTPGVTRMQLDTNGNLTTYGLATISPGSQSVDSALVISGNVYKGGIGYHDFLRVTNQYSAATNPNKYFRLDSAGTLQIINSAYTNNLFNLTDGGDATIAGKLSVGTGIFWSGNGNPISTGGGGSISGISSYSSNSSVLATYTTSSTSQTSGAFQVLGGRGVAGNVFAGNVLATGFFYANGAPFVSSNYGNVQMLANLASAGNLVVGSSIYANTAGTTTTVANLVTANGVFWPNGSPYSSGGSGSGIIYTASNTVPSSPHVGDQWYYQATDTLYEYINDGTQNVWVDIQSSPTSAGVGSAVTGNLTVNGNLTVTANTYLANTTVAGTQTVTTLVTTGNATVRGNLFVTSNAAAGTVTRVEYNIPHPFMLMGAS